jgi:hypothetical protein
MTGSDCSGEVLSVMGIIDNRARTFTLNTADVSSKSAYDE